MENPLDDDALAVAPSIIREEEEEDHPQHSYSNQVWSWKPYNPDYHIPQPTFIPPDEYSEEVLQYQWEEEYLVGDLEGANANNKDTPRSIYFEETPDNFALPGKINHMNVHLNMRQQMLRYYCGITINMDISPSNV